MPAFVNPIALWGLLLASAPIIIHLLNRRRFKVVEWAAMEFLLASARKNNRRVRIEQLILLALRVIVILILVLAIARPVVRRRALASLAERRRFALLVFDSSMSMGYRDGATTSYDRALAFAEELMASLREGDTWALVNAVEHGKAIVQEPSFDLDAARAAVARDRLPLSDAGGSLPRALEAAEEALKRSQEGARDLYIVTDLQRASWLAAAGTLAQEDVERTKRISQTARIILVDVGPENPSNLAVASLETDGTLVVAGGETVIRAQLSNFGPDTASGPAAHLLVDGFRQQKSAAKAIAPGGSTQLEFRHVFRAPGIHTVSVELDADNLPKDDHRSLALDARESVRVLLVDGEPGTEAFSGETDYLRRCLRPGDAASAAGALSLFQPEVVTVEGLSGADLPRYDAVVLANVERLTDAAAATVESYVRRGGALLVFPGERLDRAFYNRTLHRDGQGLLPCSLGNAVGDANDRKQAVHISNQLGDHPFVRLFREQKMIRLSSPFFFRYCRLEGVEREPGGTGLRPVSPDGGTGLRPVSPTGGTPVPPGAGARVVCRFDGGAPAIVEGPAGKGRVVVFASTADDAWNDMPAWPAYLTLMQEILTQVARDPGSSRNLTVGEPIVCYVSPQQFGKPVMLLRPGESKPVPLQATSSSGLLAVVYPHTDKAGIYELTLPDPTGGTGLRPVSPDGGTGLRPVSPEAVAQPPSALSSRQDFFAVNVPSRESDVRRITEPDLRKLLPGTDFDYQRGGIRRATPAEAGESGELWRSLAYVLLGLLLLESLLAQRFGR
ncbi:MAG: VWA domain-containing protein [Planctomycetes bacterium]|nr:VWA domain-containing protein [Planctomycetota bacterium]